MRYTAFSTTSSTSFYGQHVQLQNGRAHRIEQLKLALKVPSEQVAGLGVSVGATVRCLPDGRQTGSNRITSRLPVIHPGKLFGRDEIFV